MMILLALLAVGLLTLSSVSLRASNQGQALVEARSNAKMAAMMAIGQLQGLTGLDTRVTASAKLLDESNVEVAGAWRSWEGTNHGSDGMPIPPDYGTKTQAGDPSDPVGSSGSGRFLGWLTSTAFGKTGSTSEVPGTATTGSGEMIKMVSTGTLDTADEVYIEPTIIKSADGKESGAFSWWTTGDNTKALVNVGSEETASSESDWQKRLRGNLLPDPDIFGLPELDGLTTEDVYIPTRRSLELVSSAALTGDEFYDITTYSRGLLTNVATGGWRKDLSIFSEYYNQLSSSRLPLFAQAPGQDLEFSRASTGSRPSNALMYHWADYLGASGNPAWKQTPPVCSWTALANYMTQYKSLRTRSTSSIVMSPDGGSVSASGTQGRYNFQEKIRIHPQVARIQWVFSLGAVQVGQQYNPGIVVTPIITLWNPYNIALTVQGFQINFDEVFPLRMDFEVAGKAYVDRPMNSIVNNNIRANFPTISLDPGENKVYGMNNTTPVTNTGSQVMQLAEGYRPNGGAIFTRLNDHDNNPSTAPIAISATATDSFKVTNVEFAANGLEGVGASEGIGVRFQVNSQVANSMEIIVMSYDKNDMGGDDVISKLYPPITAPLPVTVGDITGSRNVPFTTATLGLRMISPPPPDTRFQNLRTKGILQANPLQHYAEVGAGNDGNAIVNLAGSGAYHTINAPYDFIIQEAQDWNDSAVTVDFDASTRRGYIVSGTRSIDGVNRCVIAELPTRPLQSLADLQHFDVRNNNQMPPFQFNLIGNSSAHPIFGPDQVSISTAGPFAGLSNDDSYLLNHVLFDDWFISSIAPDTQNFSAREERSDQEVMTEFLEGTRDLPNRFYLPSILANDDDPDTIARAYMSGRVNRDNGLYPFQTVASLMEVEGMFNINSVSVDAWRAILRRNRDLEVPYFSGSGSVSTEPSKDPAFPRTTVASDVSTTGNTVTGGNPHSAAVGGYPALTDTQIDALAEEIVSQIRSRGPFLSLGEFVNRQLSSDTDKALAGTIQRALDILSESSSSAKNPFQALMQAGEFVTNVPPGATDYKFPEAAFGSTNFGVPGWVRQADILRPLAPIMSARDDTFTIRTYGDSRDPSGTIQARAWCEVVVQRTPNYVDETDDAVVIPQSSDMSSEVNRLFGRRYQLVSFRWLNESEV
ncbi:hypothetical protein ACFQY0_08635 [Haloferula chungangensis]|uniref:Verru_Chthon cassette protein A n=1 Tax=Haloferula chungangensis TaxID=1048331 RepID=A0ABW2L6Q1_9BACT